MKKMLIICQNYWHYWEKTDSSDTTDKNISPITNDSPLKIYDLKWKKRNLDELICMTGVSLWFLSEGEQIVTWSQHQLLRPTLSL